MKKLFGLAHPKKLTTGAVARRLRGASTSLNEGSMTQGVQLGLLAAVLGTLAIVGFVVKQSEDQRTMISVAEEVRQIGANLASYDDIAPVGSDAAAGTAGVKTEAIAAISEISPKVWKKVSVTSADQSFIVAMSDLKTTACNRMALNNLGPNATADTTNCATGTLAVSYTE